MSLAPALLSLMASYWGDEVHQLHLFWLVATIFLLPGAVALIVQSARVKQSDSAWRNIPIGRWWEP